MCGDEMQLIDRRPVPDDLSRTVTADGVEHRPTCCGTLPLKFADADGRPTCVLLHNVLAMPSWPSNRILLSIGQLEQLRDVYGHSVFCKTDDYMTFTANGQSSHIPYQRGRVHYVVPLAVGPSVLPAQSQQVHVSAALPPSKPPVPVGIVHRRFNYVNPRYLQATVDQGRGLRLLGRPSSLPTPAHEAQLHGMAHQVQRVRTSAVPSDRVERNWSHHIIRTISMDVHGPYPAALNNATYYIAYHADSRMMFVTFHSTVTEAELISSFQRALLELGTPREVRMDRNMTLVTNDPSRLTEFQRLLVTLRIVLKISPPRHQEHNGIAEKSGGRDIAEKTTIHMFNGGVSHRFWCFALQHVVDTHNCVPRPSTGNRSPYYLHYGTQPYIGHFRVICCPCFLVLDKAARRPTPAFSSRVDRCIHLGVARDSPIGTYLVYNLRAKRLVVSRDVYFDEEFRFVHRTPDGWVFAE